MKSTTVRSVLPLCFVLLALLIVSVPYASGQRGWRQGDMWMKWSQQARGAYVLGYFEAHSAGQGEDCKHTANDWSAGANVEDVASSITSFYARYPEDRDIYIQEVIQQLGQGLTPDQIHKHPFWRHPAPSQQQ